MNILKYICLPGLLVSGDIQTVSAVESKTDKNPNILVILIDDAGYNDFGFMGSKEMQTPNIDALTSEGVVFTDAHVAATVSSPSRACQQEFHSSILQNKAHDVHLQIYFL